jgi:hypothetical protein
MESGEDQADAAEEFDKLKLIIKHAKDNVSKRASMTPH